MNIVLSTIQIILSLILSTLIFLQAQGRNENNSNILSSSGSEKRGWEKMMFNLTIFITLLFLISSIAQLTY
ncbi:preprotein translocase subunit SecG [Candidatus Shapirobacteria bacterium CG06_land_8_20_14_3_00_40_12]|uniref:Preprotein translocase subunit SecG n=2 Tax=Candidatus Shapironibacteriota TaxID=1752721 RepID=A0A2M7TRX4_9BACT|nr:MAG: preprotein translocase subunit SecG [Candidatus Shapirobacteria bacterium CG06_land_8_20_14_3_00_40_12]PIZ58198.1 MAG: preprotein translocase subunit SecG [Candidatus Shapirobacteria bacterium CG_4_10_14_0_2_um_filter_40_12]